MRYTRTMQYTDLEDWILAHETDLLEIANDWYQSEYETFFQIGRRVIEIYGSDHDTTVTKYATISDACERMEWLHENRGAGELDLILYQDHRGDWCAGYEGSQIASGLGSRTQAEYAAARWCVESGYYPDTFLDIGERGITRRIDISRHMNELERRGVTYRHASAS